MFKKIKNIRQQATEAFNKAKTMVSKKQNEQINLNETDENIISCKNENIINLLCLFAFKYQHRWTNGKKQIIEQYCQTIDDNNYFTQLRLTEEQGYSLFNPQHARQLFSDIRITHTATSFDHWVEFQQKLLTDILHLLALSGCSATEVLKEGLQLSNEWRIGEDVCQIAYNQQQTAQHNNEIPYNLAI